MDATEIPPRSSTYSLDSDISEVCDTMAALLVLVSVAKDATLAPESALDLVLVAKRRA